MPRFAITGNSPSLGNCMLKKGQMCEIAHTFEKALQWKVPGILACEKPWMRDPKALLWAQTSRGKPCSASAYLPHLSLGMPCHGREGCRAMYTPCSVVGSGVFLGALSLSPSLPERDSYHMQDWSSKLPHSSHSRDTRERYLRILDKPCQRLGLTTDSLLAWLLCFCYYGSYTPDFHFSQACWFRFYLKFWGVSVIPS